MITMCVRALIVQVAHPVRTSPAISPGVAQREREKELIKAPFEFAD